MVDRLLTPDGRVFAAVVPPPETVAALAHHLGPVDLPGRAVPPANWHVTLRFVGQVDEITYERWLGALSEIRVEPVRIRLRGLGAFPNRRKATVLWAGVDAGGLETWAEAVEEACQSAGMAPEERPFRPHLTLSRVRPPADVRPLIERSSEAVVGEWRADSFSVMAAVGSRYRVYETFP